MKQTTSCAGWGIPVLAGLIGTVVLVLWLGHDPAADLVLHVPGMDGEPARKTVVETVEIGSVFRSGDGVPADISGSWPGFRGPNLNHISTDSVALAEQWDDGQPRVLWQIDLGEGHAGAAIHRGRVYVLDYDEALRRDLLRCLSLADGREIWQRGYQVEIARNHGMSRTVPAVTDHFVVTIGPRGHVMCVDAETGDFLWGIDLVAEYGTDIPMWYTGQCPLIVNDVAIIAPAGNQVLMMGVDCATGDILWQTPNEQALDMSHSSITKTEIDGVKQYIYAGLGGVAGIKATGEGTGELLWFASEWDRSVVAPSPVHLGNGHIFLTAGYGGGSMLLEVKRKDDVFTAEVRDTFRANRGLASEQQTPVLFNGLLFAIVPNDAGPTRNQLVCVDPEDPRSPLWTSGHERRFGLGPYIVADGRLYVLSDDGTLHMVRVNADSYEELGRKQVLDGHDAWGPLALAGGLLVLRDDTRMLCVDLR